MEREKTKIRRGWAILPACIIFMFIGLADAAHLTGNTVNISIDSPFELCLTSDFVTSTCNETQVISLDGTEDHILYFTQPQFTGDNMAQDEINANVFDEPIRMFFGGGVIFIMFITGVAFYSLLSWIK